MAYARGDSTRRTQGAPRPCPLPDLVFRVFWRSRDDHRSGPEREETDLVEILLLIAAHFRSKLNSLR